MKFIKLEEMVKIDFLAVRNYQRIADDLAHQLDIL